MPRWPQVILTTVFPPGLLDFGYNSEEIALILGVAGPESPVDRALEDLEQFAEISDGDLDTVNQLEEERPYTPDFDDDGETEQQGDSISQRRSSRADAQDSRAARSPLRVNTDHAISHEESFESQVARK